MGVVVDLNQYRRQKRKVLLVTSAGGDEQTLEALERMLKATNESIPYGRTVQEREHLAISTIEISRKIAVLKRKLADK